MNFLKELQKQRKKLKETETIVTNVDGKRFVESKNDVKTISSNMYGFVVDTKPDNVPIMVTEHLYIGSQDCTNESVLINNNIKHVLSLGIYVPVPIDQKFVDCLDLPETDIKPVLRECLPYINVAIDSKENVLVHCNAGVSRTSMVAIAYLMQYKNMSYDDAYELVKDKRPAIQPNDGFKKQLRGIKPSELI
ncbi:hypothetical protein O3G_MSEX005640 [Manduca sexta]|uniref:Dual specificity protein phosphatase 19 n=1 Tax=Manduca sexta TaxID=7130 RepID=A0A922CJV0_MANSE|nr:hypothetical protein O3G_MSEX005640 [Manduca sexta]